MLSNLTAVDPELLKAFSTLKTHGRLPGRTTAMLWDAVATDKSCNYVIGASYAQSKQLLGVMCDMLDDMEIPYDVHYGNRIVLREENVMWLFTSESSRRVKDDLGRRNVKSFYDHYVFEQQEKRFTARETGEFLRSLITPKTYGGVYA